MIHLINKHKFLVSLIIIDSLLLLLHIFFSQYSLFNLDREANLPTAYQGLKLIMFAHILIVTAYLHDNFKLRENFFLVILIVFFVLLGVDEMATIHENVPRFIAEITRDSSQIIDDTIREEGYQGSIWVIYYIPLFVIFTILMIFQISKIYQCLGKYVWIFIFSVLLIILVPILEAFNTSDIIYYSPLYTSFMALEEFFEMIGISLFGYIYYLYYKTKYPVTKTG